MSTPSSSPLFRQSTTTMQRSTTATEHSSQQSQSPQPPVVVVSFRARIVAGSVGSIITALCMTPLEVVKVHLQNAKPITTTTTTTSVPHNVAPCPKGCGTFVLNNGLVDCVLPKCQVPYFDNQGNLKLWSNSVTNNKNGPATISSKPLQQPQRFGTFAMVRNIFVKEGFQGIYAGLAPTLVMGVPSTVFYYAAYDEVVARARHSDYDYVHATREAWGDAWIPMFAGSSARLLTTLLISPLELVRTRQASRVGEGLEVQGMMAEFRSIVHSEGGVAALYKGLSPTLWRDVPFSGIYWVCLEQFRILYGPHFLGTRGGGESPTSLQQAGLSFVSGATAGMVAAACTTPFDVVKTRAQSEILTAAPSPSTSNAAPEMAACGCDHSGHAAYRSATTTTTTSTSAGGAGGRSIWSALSTIYETEGMYGLWRGNTTRMIKVAPSCAIMIMCYEFGKNFLTHSEY